MRIKVKAGETLSFTTELQGLPWNHGDSPGAVEGL
jgi:hypothetical protein